MPCPDSSLTCLKVGQVPWLDKFLMKNPLLLWLDARGYISTSDRIVQYALKQQAAHQAKRKNGLDSEGKQGLLDKFLDIREAHPDEVTDREMMGLGLTMIFAGAESTAITLTGIFYFLLKNQPALDRLLKEIDTLPTPITFNATQKLPYLDACIKESFRLLPISGALPERVIPSSGAMVCGHFVPAGTIVGATAWVLHRNRSVFGEDVEVFRPERWLGEETKVKEMNQVLVNFGSGVHVCLGKNIALMEIYKLIPEILRRFEVCVSNHEKKFVQLTTD
jgi:cytochrome P450